MGKVNYRNWAYVIRFFLCLYVATTLIGFVLSIIGLYTKTDFNIQRIDYGYRNYKKGYPVKTDVYFDIPHTVFLNENGTLTYNERNGQHLWIRKGLVNDTIINQFKNINNANSDQMANFVGVPDQVSVNVTTSNTFHQWFYIVYDHLPRLFYALICLWAILLINNYLRQDFFKPKTYKIITKLGVSFISMNVLMFIFQQMNLHILPDFYFQSVSKNTGALINSLQVNVVTRNRIDASFMLIGVIILIWSEIIKNAVLIKKEQDLTI